MPGRSAAQSPCHVLTVGILPRVLDIASSAPWPAGVNIVSMKILNEYGDVIATIHQRILVADDLHETVVLRCSCASADAKAALLSFDNHRLGDVGILLGPTESGCARRRDAQSHFEAVNDEEVV